MRNTTDLRAFLIDRLEGLASGKESIAQSHAVAALAKQVNTTLALELSAHRILASSEPNLRALQVK